MNKTTRLIAVLALLVLLGAGVYVYHTHTTPSAAGGEAAARATADAFGKQLQLVSLLAPADALADSITDAYGPLVAPELLDSWIADPSTAPGRQTSSPWPDHLVITSVEERPDGSYDIAGQVIEMTSAGEEVSGTPVELRVEAQDGAWRITRFEGYPASS